MSTDNDEDRHKVNRNSDPIDFEHWHILQNDYGSTPLTNNNDKMRPFPIKFGDDNYERVQHPEQIDPKSTTISRSSGWRDNAMFDSTVGEPEAVKENEETVTADSVLTTDDEYASIMPVLSDLEYVSLKSSIQEHGQPFPIVVNQNGVILDGHHRYKASHELGITTSVLVRQFENRLQEKKFIIEVNRSRRHLNEFQRIELQLKLESIKSEIVKERMPDPGKIGAEK